MDERITSRSDDARNEWMFNLATSDWTTGTYYAKSGEELKEIKVQIISVGGTRTIVHVDYFDGNEHGDPGFSLTVQDRKGSIHYINKSKTHTGTQNLQLAEEIARMYGANCTQLIDASQIIVYPALNRGANLALIHILRTGLTWYQSHGYFTVSIDRAAFDGNVERLRNLKMADVLDELKMNESTTVRALFMRMSDILSNIDYKDLFYSIFMVKGPNEEAPWREWEQTVYKWFETLRIRIDYDAIDPENIGKYPQRRDAEYEVHLGNYIYGVKAEVKLYGTVLVTFLDGTLSVRVRGGLAVIEHFQPTVDTPSGELIQLAIEICRIHEALELRLHEETIPWKTIIKDDGLHPDRGLGRFLPDTAEAVQINAAVQNLLQLEMGKLLHVMPLNQPDETMASYMLRLWKVDEYAYCRMEALMFDVGNHNRDLYSWTETWRHILDARNGYHRKFLGTSE